MANIILTKRSVFRFSRNLQGTIELGSLEERYRILANYSFDVEIPKLETVNYEYGYIKLSRVPGVTIKDCYQSLDLEERQNILSQLASFLNQFHNSNIHGKNYKKEVDEIEKLMEFNPKSHEDFLKAVMLLVAKTEDIDSERIWDFLANKILNQSNVVTCHGDLSLLNIIYDKESKKVGIIDFSDFRITGPELDFAFLYNDLDLDEFKYFLKQYNNSSNIELNLESIQKRIQLEKMF